jgi:hypothetical protein
MLELKDVMDSNLGICLLPNVRLESVWVLANKGALTSLRSFYD